MSKCADCHWYSKDQGGMADGLEANDRCHHDKSAYQIGGVRTDSVIVFHPCQSMLKGICENHKLFEPRSA